MLAVSAAWMFGWGEKSKQRERGREAESASKTIEYRSPTLVESNRRDGGNTCQDILPHMTETSTLIFTIAY